VRDCLGVLRAEASGIIMTSPNAVPGRLGAIAEDLLCRDQPQDDPPKTEAFRPQDLGGRGRAPLPGVKTDARHVNATDKCGYDDNRELARLIKKAMGTVKKTDKGGQHFVLGWRLYPNKKHPRWNNKDVHSCGCGCGCSAWHGAACSSMLIDLYRFL
jgi:hypothetical protein